MRRLPLRLGWVGWLLTIPVVAAAASWQTAEELVAWCAARSRECRTWVADFSHTVPVMGVPVTIRGQIMGRSPQQLRMESVIPMFGKQAEWLVVVDAQGVIWQEMTTGNRIQVVRGRAEDAGAFFPQAGMPWSVASVWEGLPQSFTLTLGPTVERDGHRWVALEATPRAIVTNSAVAAVVPAATGVWRVFIDTADGWPRRLELLSGSDREVMSVYEITNLRLNEPLADALFEYTPPAGVPVMELRVPAFAPVPSP